MTRLLPLRGLVLVALFVACGYSNALAPATIDNAVDTLTLTSVAFAQGPALTAPGAYSVSDNVVVRTDLTTLFDFAYLRDDATNRDLLLPLAVLGLSNGSALRPGLIASTTLTFDQITLADLNGYVTDDTVPAHDADVFEVRSRPVCSSLGLPLYAKIEILSHDSVAHTLTFRTLANTNCGYRSLRVGLPTE